MAIDAHSEAKKFDTNCELLSVMMVFGMLYDMILLSKTTMTTSDTAVVGTGIARVSSL